MPVCSCIVFRSLREVAVERCVIHRGETPAATNRRWRSIDVATARGFVVGRVWRDGWDRDFVMTPARVAFERKQAVGARYKQVSLV